MSTVTIGGQPYESYGDVAGADAYLAASIAMSAIWTAAAAVTDKKAKALRSATLMIDRQVWEGVKVLPTQTTQFPRTGLIRADGTLVDSGSVPQEVVWACYELAAILCTSTAPLTNTTSGNNVKRMEAKGTSIEFWSPSDRTAGRFPTVVQELIGQFLAGFGATSTGNLGGYASGTSQGDMSDSVAAGSSFDDDYGLSSVR